jgi:two-component system heavy metal sensor histidine kinase CusS
MSSTSHADAAGPGWSLAARLTTWSAGSSFLLISSATGILYWALFSNLDREDDLFLQDKARALAALLRSGQEESEALRREVAGSPTARATAGMLVRVLDAEGNTLLETSGMDREVPAGLFPVALPENDSDLRGREVHSPTGKIFRAAAVQVSGVSGHPGRVIQVAFDRTFEEHLLERYRINLGLVLLAALGVCSIIGYQIARRGLQPLNRIATTARQIRSSNLQERIATNKLPAEVHVLAVTFNDMLDRLEKSFTQLSQFSADIAHELRTPVHNLRGEAEVALQSFRTVEEYREVISSCLEEYARLTRLIESLLFLARAENPETQIARELVEVGPELDVAREFYDGLAAETGIALRVEAAQGLTAPLDRALFRQAISNLLANAIAHTPAQGTVTLRAAKEDGDLLVAVSDTGVGIPPEHLPHVFDRFYRADRARSNSAERVGLGLAIVRSIAVLHGGSASVASSAGQGTTVSLRFPAGSA